ncbi:hypothetical protein [Ornithinibacillus californiensis]|uniref:hypothetical protein n=1 Tax=Ornithinibacillus californiensis TaxID=161536 RepID=UPI00064DD319|nr:hypothetical protein [Ornithinibacillus californiensis]
MEKHLEVMKQSLALLETVIDGLKHNQKLINEGKHDESILLFENTVQAFSTVERSFEGLPENLLTSESKEISIKVKNAIELVVDAYESKAYGKVQEILQFTLIPTYNKWKSGLEDNFQRYLIS